MSGNRDDVPWWVKAVVVFVIFICAGLALKFAYDHVISPTTTSTSK